LLSGTFLLKAQNSPTLVPLPAPPVPGNTDTERFDNAVRKAFTVSKEEMQRREAEWQKTHGNEVQRKKPV